MYNPEGLMAQGLLIEYASDGVLLTIPSADMELYEKFYFKASFKIGARDSNGFYAVRVDSIP